MGYSEPINYITFKLSHAPLMESLTSELQQNDKFLNSIYKVSASYSLFGPYPLTKILTTEFQQNKYNT